MNEKEFRSGVMDDGSKVVHGAIELKSEPSDLSSHYKLIRDKAQIYIKPDTFYTNNDGEVFADGEANGACAAFIDDVVRLSARNDFDYPFDYVEQASLTLSDKFHGELVSKFKWNK